MNRRFFMQKGSMAAMTLLNLQLSHELLDKIRSHSHETAPHQDEDFWKLIRQAYHISPSIINLNNAGLSPQVRRVQEAEIRYLEFSNEVPSFNMWRVLGKDRNRVRENLAKMASVHVNEIAIHRNATEALDTIIFGLTLKAGDEVVLCKQDYPLMIHAWNQRAAREGIILKWVDLKLPSEDKEYLIKSYTSAFGPKTKIVHLTHMINWTGQILPVKEITEAAHQKGIRVILDAAQSFAQLEFSFSELGVDYAGTALHKWLGAPFGTGMLYVKEEHIVDLWPLFPTENPRDTSILKFENLGSRPTHAEVAIGQAIEFHELIGTKRKHERLQYLKEYWVEKATKLPFFKLHSSMDPQFGGVITNFSIEGQSYDETARLLFSRHRIHTSPVKWDGIEGVRATPNVYTSLVELDRFVQALGDLF
ncbi:MAG: aminotransferase class V-fold PLP-dependent enzyme [Bacteroidia bacterium]|nr:aminotransferase class V-fold PLP-dependent enzyme [Bacteroidia bacterium]